LDVSVIIVTYNSADCIEACLASVAAQTGIDAETILVDNASADDTVGSAKGFGVNVVENQDNLGYGQANNRGVAVSRGRFIHLLNPDSQLVEPYALARLCRAMEAHPGWGVAGTRIVSTDDTNEVSPAVTYPGQQHVRRDFSKLPGRIAWVLGASMIVRREIYAALDGFDPGFFLYCEETDFCLRARELGHEIGYVKDVTVRHIGGTSELGRDPYEICRLRMTSMLRFRQKHYSAEDAARLARRDQYRARFRMLWYGLWSRSQPAGSTAWRKQREYTAIWEISRNVLAGNR
jgi:GT2 family glycosyltransferase